MVYNYATHTPSFSIVRSVSVLSFPCSLCVITNIAIIYPTSARTTCQLNNKQVYKKTKAGIIHSYCTPQYMYHYHVFLHWWCICLPVRIKWCCLQLAMILYDFHFYAKILKCTGAYTYHWPCIMKPNEINLYSVYYIIHTLIRWRSNFRSPSTFIPSSNLPVTLFSLNKVTT